MGHLHFFLSLSYFQRKHGTWSLLIINQKTRGVLLYTSSASTPGEKPHLCHCSCHYLSGAEEPANSFIHTANICWIPISQALQGDSNTRAFYWISQKPQCQLGEQNGGWAEPTLQTLYTLEPTRMYSVGLGCALSLWKSGWAMLHALLKFLRGTGVLRHFGTITAPSSYKLDFNPTKVQVKVSGIWGFPQVA